MPEIKALDFLCDIYKGYVKILLLSAYEEHKNSIKNKLEVKVKPTHALVCKEAFKAHELNLVPLSTSVSIYEKGKYNAAVGGVTFGHMFNHPTKGTEMIAVISQAKSVLPSSQEDPLAIPYWFVVGKGDKAVANLEPGTYKYTTNFNGATDTFFIPILTNPKALQIGDELTKYKPVAVKPETKRALPASADKNPKAKAKAKAV